MKEKMFRYLVHGSDRDVLKTFSQLKNGNFVNYTEYGASVPRMMRVVSVNDWVVKLRPVIMPHIIPAIIYEDDDE